MGIAAHEKWFEAWVLAFTWTDGNMGKHVSAPVVLFNSVSERSCIALAADEFIDVPTVAGGVPLVDSLLLAQLRC